MTPGGLSHCADYLITAVRFGTERVNKFLDAGIVTDEGDAVHADSLRIDGLPEPMQRDATEEEPHQTQSRCEEHNPT